MTKRKMQRKIITVVLVLFFCSTLMIFWGCGELLLRNLNVFWSDTSSNEFMHEFYESDEKDTVALHRKMTFGHNPVYSTNSKPAFAFAMIDKEKNVVFRSESGIWWTMFEARESGFNYVSIEEYMTEELKNEILKYQKRANGRSVMFKELELYFDGKEYTPVSFTLDDQSNDIRKFTFTDLPVTHTITDKTAGLYYYLHDLDENSIDHIYYERTAAKIEEKISKFVFDDFEGGGGFNSTGEMSWNYSGEDYAFFYEVEYNYPLEVISSDVFGIFTFYLFVMFAIVSVIILVSASKLYDRQKNFEQSKRAFISAAAHELKTPLAVIQNQCECVLDNIAPDKNGEYVKSVYEEAVRMNGIVKSLLTFNKLSDLSKISKEKINLSELAKEEIRKYLPFAESYGAAVTENIEDSIFTECNSELITMAIDNYLSNAIKYATNEKNINVTLRRNGKYFIFKIYNDFDGVFPDEDVWDILIRTDKARNSSANSTGIGLPICRKIFSLHSYEYRFIAEKSGISFIFQGKLL